MRECNALKGDFRVGQGIVLPTQNSRKKVLYRSAFLGQKRYICRRIEPRFGRGGILLLPHPFSWEKPLVRLRFPPLFVDIGGLPGLLDSP